MAEEPCVAGSSPALGTDLTAATGRTRGQTTGGNRVCACARTRREVDVAPPYAAWGQRAVALLIDAVLAIVFAFTLPLGVGLVVSLVKMIDPSAVPSRDTYFQYVVAGVWAIPVAYWVIGNAIGQTLGKKIMRIRVRREDADAPIGFFPSLVRYIVTLLLAALFLIPGILDGLWPLYDPKKQSLHDRVVGSIVVRA